MYQDPALIRKHVSKVYWNDEEAALVNALTAYTGQQRGVLLRQIILDHAAEILAATGSTNEGLMEVLRQA